MVFENGPINGKFQIGVNRNVMQIKMQNQAKGIENESERKQSRDSRGFSDHLIISFHQSF